MNKIRLEEADTTECFPVKAGLECPWHQPERTAFPYKAMLTLP
jgi:hypothetical protein